MKFQDQLKRVLELKTTPKRIVSLVPSQTELLIDLGLESSIVGITKFCVHPVHLKKSKTIVGGTKQVRYDKIKALHPDIILCNKEENTQEMISELEHIAPVHISDIYSLDDTLELIELYGELFSVGEKSNSLIQDIEIEYQKFLNYISNKSALKVVYFIWKSPWMIAAKHTFIDEMLRLNNFINHFGNLDRYPEININDIDENIDVIMLSSEPYPFKIEDVNTLSKKFPKSKVILVDGEYFSWYGSRLKNAFKYFKNLHESLKQ